MNTGQILQADDLCRLRAWYSLRWKPPFLSSKEILIRAVEHGLMAEDDAGEAAEQHAMDLAVDPGLDTEQIDLLAVAEHVSALANIIAWIIRGTQMPYKRPEPVKLPDGSTWTSSAFLDASERHLRRVVLLNRWDAWAQSALERSWEVSGETSVYGVGMDCLIVEIGSLRDGRWSNPFTRAYRHPVAKDLRFKKRDGEDFGSTWNIVRREEDSATREQWLDGMIEDGVLTDLIHVHSVEPSVILHGIEERLQRIAGDRPEENFTACFDKVRPCPYRSCCPRGLEPSQETGFIPTTSDSHA